MRKHIYTVKHVCIHSLTYSHVTEQFDDFHFIYNGRDNTIAVWMIYL